MVERKTPVIVSGIWQFLRFIVLVLSVILYLNPRLTAGGSLLVVLLAAPSLVLAVGCFVGGTDNQKFNLLKNFLLFGKLLEILPGLTLLLFQAGAMFFGIARPVFDEVLVIDELLGYTVETERIFYYLLAGIVLVDLIFLLVLLSYRREPDGSEPDESEPVPLSGENLPEYKADELDEGQ